MTLWFLNNTLRDFVITQKETNQDEQECLLALNMPTCLDNVLFISSKWSESQ